MQNLDASPSDKISSEDVSLFVPDTALREKVGNVPFDRIVPQEAVIAAEKVIEDSSSVILENTLDAFRRLRRAAGQLSPGPLDPAALKAVIDAAFAVKSSAGFCGHDFATKLANSLYVFCERLNEDDHDT